MSVHTNMKEKGNPMSLVKNYRQRRSPLISVRGLCILMLLHMLTGCGGTFSSTPPSASRSGAGAGGLVTAPVHTTDATLAQVFSDNIFVYQPCQYPQKACPEIHVIGNPVYSYSIDLASGLSTSLGIPNDTIPVNTISTAVAPSGDFEYVLAGSLASSPSKSYQFVRNDENLIYTFSIGYLTLSVNEFRISNLDPLRLYNALSSAGHITGDIAGTVLSSEEVVDKLIAVLEEPALFDRLFAKNPGAALTDEIQKLKAETVNSRPKSFSDLSYNEKKSIVNLNRLMLELVYPNETPKNKGAGALHAVGSPIALPPISTAVFTSIEVEPLGKFIYILSAEKLGVFSIDQNTGNLIFRGVQEVGLGQLIFSSSGQFAYGSTNGSLQAYSIDRSTGMLSAVGDAFQFRPWMDGGDYNRGVAQGNPALDAPPWQRAPFHNMAADPTGKFLYLIGSSGTQITVPPPPAVCPEWESKHQLGSLVYTFIIDNTSGLLTQSGPALDTTPHIMIWGSVDPLGRFLQLLNTHEYYPSLPGNYQPDACTAGSTSPVAPGTVVTYYVDQNSGKLIPSGSTAAGGTEIPPAFVYAGMDSVSLTGDGTGRFLYLLNSNDMYVYDVDPADGALSPIGSPLTGAAVTAMPGITKPYIWPSVCFTDSIWNGFCTFSGSRSHSMTWAGY